MNRTAWWMWQNLEPELKAKLFAGKHKEYASLQRLWREGAAAEAEKWALRLACEDVVFDSAKRMD